MRFVFGPQFNASIPQPIVPEPPAPKLDIAVELLSVDEVNKWVTFRIPAYDVATHNVLEEIRVYLLPPGSTPPATVDDLVNSDVSYFASSVSDFTNGADATLLIPDDTPAGNYLAFTVLGFDQ